MLKIFKNQKGFTLIEILVVVIIVAILAAIAVPIYLKYVNQARASEAQSAISTIRKAYEVYYQSYSRTDDYSVEKALKDAKIGKSTEKSWKFEVVGNPPKKYMATSTSDFAGGEGKQVWYDVAEGKFHGYGIDQEEEDND
ncbi:MAG TPA: prepilin-type N-terminal cleavage/methylation domain-containing protein [Candidatus Cloacimonadota bacterium]|jgi:prepilin-type N-terminal cleavage/methylation domain-containing protein|nr:prepilin-type N-terminal cleavage/methylation domain-containing protein [Candidatus Cloacimonadales bacterium]HPY96044.1 prepilin-type N-terminal cleavage/methylation domain-containing protein [Candidatus Cloacimonadota bacterium]HQB40577.1 prepilin-type N-terminal cleavage/methylation domain-containing protein [Candidatus Cloacimonadota bacterium]